jgi:hypothetical protein
MSKKESGHVVQSVLGSRLRAKDQMQGNDGQSRATFDLATKTVLPQTESLRSRQNGIAHRISRLLDECLYEL